MRFLKILAFGLALSLFQGSLEVAWRLGGPAPDLLLLWVVWLGMQRRTTEALAVAFCGGLVFDAVAGSYPMGAQSLSKVAVAYLPEWAHYILLPENRLTGFLMVAAATVIQQIVLLTVHQTLVETLDPSGIVWGKGALVETGTLVVLNLVFWGIVTYFVPPAKGEEVSP